MLPDATEGHHLEAVFKHSQFFGFLKASQESDMQILFQNCMPDKFAFTATAKFVL